MTTTTPPRIYVASLSDYNAGRLHGVWIDLTEINDIDELWERVNAMLANSPEFKAFPLGGPAEEWAIHDYEGFEGWGVSEYADLAAVLEVAHLIDIHGPAVAAFVGNDSSIAADPDTIEDAFLEAYSGTFESVREFTESLVDDIGLPNVGTMRVPSLRGDGETLADALGPYLDWDALDRWATEDVWTADVPDGVAVFRNY